MLSQSDEWNGQQLGNVVAVGILPDNTLVATSSSSSVCVVHSNRFASFLRPHAEACLICADVAQFHWTLHRHLQHQGEEGALQTLWQFSRNRRLHDITLMDQRFRYVREGVFPLPKTLEELAQRYCGLRSPDRPDQRQAPHAPAVSDARLRTASTILRVYEVLQAQSVPITGNDERGAIALGPAAQARLQVAPDCLAAVDAESRRLWEMASREIDRDRHARNGFGWEGWQLGRDKAGRIQRREDRLREWLETQYEHFRDVNGFPFICPRDDQGRTALQPEYYEPLIRCHPRLNAWLDLETAAETSWLVDEDRDWFIRPRYRIVPAVEAVAPNLGRLPRLETRFVASPGFTFLILRLRDLELRCFAAVCERKYHPPDVRLAHLFRQAKEPVEDAAQRFTEHDDEESDEPRAEERDDWSKIARVLLYAVPRRLATAEIRRLLQVELNKHLSAAEVESLYSQFIRKIHPELEYFLEDTTLGRLASQLGTSERELCQSPYLPAASETMELALRNVLAGKRAGNAVWETLRREARTDVGRRIAAEGQGGSTAPDLLLDWPVTITGDVGCPCWAGQVRTGEYVELSRVLVKQVAYELAARGRPVKAVCGEVLILEMQNDEVESAHEMVRAADEVLRRVLGAVANGCVTGETSELWVPS